MSTVETEPKGSTSSSKDECVEASHCFQHAERCCHCGKLKDTLPRGGAEGSEKPRTCATCGAPIQRMDHPEDPGWIHSPGSDTVCMEARPEYSHVHEWGEWEPYLEDVRRPPWNLPHLERATCACGRSKVRKLEKPQAMPDWCDACQQDKPCVCDEKPQEPVCTHCQGPHALEDCKGLEEPEEGVCVCGHPEEVHRAGLSHPHSGCNWCKVEQCGGYRTEPEADTPCTCSPRAEVADGFVIHADDCDAIYVPNRTEADAETAPVPPWAVRDDIWRRIESEIYEWRERTALWGESDGITQSLADLARRAVEPADIPRRPPYAVAYAVEGGAQYEVAVSGDATVVAEDGVLMVLHPKKPVLAIVRIQPMYIEESDE